MNTGTVRRIVPADAAPEPAGSDEDDNEEDNGEGAAEDSDEVGSDADPQDHQGEDSGEEADEDEDPQETQTRPSVARRRSMPSAGSSQPNPSVRGPIEPGTVSRPGQSSTGRRFDEFMQGPQFDYRTAVSGIRGSAAHYPHSSDTDAGKRARVPSSGSGKTATRTQALASGGEATVSGGTDSSMRGFSLTRSFAPKRPPDWQKSKRG